MGRMAGPDTTLTAPTPEGRSLAFTTATLLERILGHDFIARAREAVVMALLDWPDDAIVRAAATPAFRFADAVRQADIGRLIDLLRVATKQLEADWDLAVLNLTPPAPAKRSRKTR